MARTAEVKIRTALRGTRHSHFSGKRKAVAANQKIEAAGICEREEAARGGVNLPYAWLREEQLFNDASVRVVAEMPPAAGTVYASKAIAAAKHAHTGSQSRRGPSGRGLHSSILTISTYSFNKPFYELLGKFNDSCGILLFC